MTTPLVTGCGRGGTHATAAALTGVGVSAKHEGFAVGQVSVGWPFGAPLGENEELGWNWPPKGRYPFESYNDAVKRLKRLQHFAPVVLLVRHPLDVIASVRRCFCSMGLRTLSEVTALNDNRSWWFVESHVNVTRFLAGVDSWRVLPLDDLRRSMAYWVGWNTLIEETHMLYLAGYAGSSDGDDEALRLHKLHLVRARANHTVRLEDPHMLERLTALLGLSPAVQRKAARTKMQNTDRGQTQASIKKKAGPRPTWADLRSADAALAQRAWEMAQRCVWVPEYYTSMCCW